MTTFKKLPTAAPNRKTKIYAKYSGRPVIDSNDEISRVINFKGRLEGKKDAADDPQDDKLFASKCKDIAREIRETHEKKKTRFSHPLAYFAGQDPKPPPTAR